MDHRPDARSLFGLVLLLLLVGGGSQWWYARAEQRIGDALAAQARPGDIRLLSSVTCGYCAHARAWLKEHRVPFDECFIERDTACSADFAARGAPGTPVVLVKQQVQLGFDPQRVLDAFAS